jgi:ketosteroid isomerase-like protein
MSAEAEVRAASERFYTKLAAFIQGDTSQVIDAWWQNDAITTGQPVGAWARGLEAVKQSWAGIATLTLVGDVKITDLSVHLHGDMAYTLGIEHATLEFDGKPFEFVSASTNIYRKVDGEWLLVHHHVNHSPALQAMLTA